MKPNHFTPCRLCGISTETKIPINGRYVRVCSGCQEKIAYFINLKRNKDIIARIK